MEGEKTVDITEQEIDAATQQRLDKVVLALALENEQLKNFIAKRDALTVNKALKGLGTNETRLMEVLCSRTKEQLERIDLACHRDYGRSLLSWVEKEVSGSFGKMVRYALMPHGQLGCSLFRSATKGVGSDEDAIIDIVNVMTNTDLADVRILWERQNNKSISDTLSDEFGTLSKNFKHLMQRMFMGSKSEDTTVDEARAEEQARALYKAGVGKFGTDEKTFVEMLSTESRAQIQAIKAAYERQQSMSLMTAINKEFSGKLKRALLGCLFPSREAYIAGSLHSAFEGMGTDKERVCRLLGCVDNRDMVAVKAYYLETYGLTLQEHLKNETMIQGDFLKATTLWVEGEDPTDGLEDQIYMMREGGAEKAKLELRQRGLLRSYVTLIDAKDIQVACKGLGTRDADLIALVCSRTKEHLKGVNAKYHELFGRSLADQIDGETTGDYRRILRYCCMQEDEFDALMVKEACDGLGTDSQRLIELLAPCDNARISAMRTMYEMRYGQPVMDRLNSELSGYMKTLCTELLKAERDEEGGTTEAQAEADADSLHAAGVGKWGTDSSEFIRIFVNSSREHVQAVKSCYENKYSHSMIHAVKSETSGQFKRGLLACLYEPIDFRCMKLREASTKMIGSDGKTICRMLGGNDKIVVSEMASRYQHTFGESVLEMLKKKLSGKLRLACMTWVSVIDPLHNEALQTATMGMENDVDDPEEFSPPPDGEESGAPMPPPPPAAMVQRSAYREAFSQGLPAVQLAVGQNHVMSVGQQAVLSQGVIDVLQMGLGWTPVASTVDLDAGCLMFDNYGNMVDKVFFGRQQGSGAFHSGDNQTGGATAGPADNESITVVLADVPAHVASLTFVVNCFNHNRSFGDVSNAYCHLRNPTGGVMCGFSLSPATPSKGLIMAVLRRAQQGSWIFTPVGEGSGGKRCDAPQMVAAVQNVLARPIFVMS